MYIVAIRKLIVNTQVIKTCKLQKKKGWREEMVQIEVKSGEEKQFLYECEISKQVKEIAREVIEIHNLQSKIHQLHFSLQHRLLSNPKGGPSDADIALLRSLSEAEAYASKDQVLHRKFLSSHVLRDHIQNIEREALLNQSLGFSDPNELERLVSDTQLLQEDTTQLWWAGKDLKRNKRLCDYVGKNEKTKIVLKLQPLESPPASHLESDSSTLKEDVNMTRPKEQKDKI